MASTKPPRSATPNGQFGDVRLHSILGYQIVQANISTLAVFDRLVGQALQLRPVEYTVLALIVENPGVAPAKLAKTLSVTAPNITMWIDRLAKRGLVFREKSETDGRAQHLHVTPEGEQLANDASARLAAGERAAFDGLTGGEWAILLELLQKVASLRPKKSVAG